MGNFAVGGLVTVGILGATAIFATFYDKLTKGAREAKKEQDALITSLEKAIHLKGLGPGGETVDQVAAAQKRADALLVRINTLEGMKVKGAMDADVMASNLVIEKKLNALYIERQNALNTLAGGQSIVNEKIKEATPALKDVKTHVVAIKKVVEDTVFSWREMLEAVYLMDNTLEKISLRNAIEMLGAPNLDVNHVPGLLKDFGTTISGVDTDIGLTKEQIKTRDALVGTLDRNTLTMRDAIWGAASQSANMIVGALNIGGGGRGSQLGGALGGTAGFAAGFIFGGGPVGGAIGSTVGNIIGSALGGLFDSNSRAVNSNTQALYANTAALLLGAPAGYSVAAGRHNATDVKEWRRDVQRFRTRGGAPILAGT